MRRPNGGYRTNRRELSCGSGRRCGGNSPREVREACVGQTARRDPPSGSCVAHCSMLCCDSGDTWQMGSAARCGSKRSTGAAASPYCRAPLVGYEIWGTHPRPHCVNRKLRAPLQWMAPRARPVADRVAVIAQRSGAIIGNTVKVSERSNQRCAPPRGRPDSRARAGRRRRGGRGRRWCRRRSSGGRRRRRARRRGQRDRRRKHHRGVGR